MRGYWINNGGKASASPVSLFNDNNIIGLSPVCVGNSIDNSLSTNSNSCIDLSKLSFSSPVLCPKFPSNYVRSSMYYEIADFTPVQFIPSNFLGYTTNYQHITEDGFKTLFIPSSTDIVTQANVYTIKCKVIRLKERFTSTTCESIDALYTDLQDYKNYYLLNFADNELLNLPTFSGKIGIKPGASGPVTSNLMKQNKHFASFGSSGGGIENINVGSLFFPRRFIRNSIYLTDLNWIDTYDVTSNPCAGFLYSPYVQKNSSSVRTDVFNNKIPFFINFCSDGGIMWTTSTEAEDLNRKEFNLNNIVTNGDLINTEHYGYKQNDFSQRFVQLPYISSNKIQAFGDGLHELDNTLVNNYNYNNRTFLPDDPLRYAYVQTTNVNVTTRYRVQYVYWVITYISNDVQTINVNSSLPNHWFGHIESNAWN